MTETPPRLLNLVEVAAVLGMKKSNVAKFLLRRGVDAAFTKAQGNLWHEDVILAVKAEREADTARLASDRKRRATARRNATPPTENGTAPVGGPSLGPRETSVLLGLISKPKLNSRAETEAARRLSRRGLVERVDGETATFRLTSEGRALAGSLS